MFISRIIMANKVVQYVVVRGDLKWPTGALIGQGCHASVAAIFSNKDNPGTGKYLDDLDNMTKVVLKANSEEQILESSQLLTENNVAHYIWREQPENIITAMATVPAERDILKPLLKDYPLFR